MSNVVTQQLLPVSRATPDQSIHMQPVAFFDSEGNPITLTGTDDTLTGYTVATGWDDVEATDTVKQAIQKVEGKVNAAGDAVGDGYEIDATGGALADTDTLLEMIGKLEKRIDDLENP